MASFIENQNTTVALTENRNVSMGLGVEKHLSKIQILKTIHHNPNVRPGYQCFKITPSGRGEKEIDLKIFTMRWEIKFPNASSECEGGKIYPSTEKNSYGVT